MVSTSRASASGIKVINSVARIVAATLIARRARALIFPAGRTAAAIRSITPTPQRRSSSRSATPSRACSHGRPAACTRPSRRSWAGATTTTLHQATGSPAAIFSAPATTSAERPSPPELARTGQASAETGTATISVASASPHATPSSAGRLAAEDGTG